MYANRGDVRRAVLTEHFCKNAPLHITDTLIGKLTYTSSLSPAPCPDRDRDDDGFFTTT